MAFATTASFVDAFTTLWYFWQISLSCQTYHKAHSSLKPFPSTVGLRPCLRVDFSSSRLHNAEFRPCSFTCRVGCFLPSFIENERLADGYVGDAIGQGTQSIESALFGSWGLGGGWRQPIVYIRVSSQDSAWQLPDSPRQCREVFHRLGHSDWGLANQTNQQWTAWMVAVFSHNALLMLRAATVAQCRGNTHRR